MVRQLRPLEQFGLLSLIDGEAELTPGVRAVKAAGHTPGHTMLELDSRGRRAVIQGDIAVHHVLLARPTWTPAFDFDAGTARSIRDRELARWADEELLVLAKHFPPPGYGRIHREGKAWRWVPAN